MTGNHDRANVGGPCIVIGRKGSHGSLHWLNEPAFISDTAFGIDSSTTTADLRWLYYVLSTLRLSDLTNDVGVPGLSRESVYEQDIGPVPSLEEQRRIANFLDDQVTRLDDTASAVAGVVEHGSSRFNSTHAGLVAGLFQRFGSSPLRRFVDGIEQGSSPLAAEMSAASGQPGVIRTSAIAAGRFRGWDNKALLREDDLERRYLLRKGDVLIVRGSGSADLVGDAALVRLNEDDVLMLSDLTYRLIGPRLDPAFIVEVLVSAPLRSQVRPLVRQGSGPAKLRGSDVLDLPIPPAPGIHQAQTVRAIAEVREESSQTTRAGQTLLDRLEERKRALITACVTGAFDVSTASQRALKAHHPRLA